MKISAKFRVKYDVPFSIETVSGVQYRCGICGKVYFKRSILDKHLLLENSMNIKVPHFPEINSNLTLKVIYTQDVRDLTNPNYPKLKKGDHYLKIKNNG